MVSLTMSDVENLPHPVDSDGIDENENDNMKEHREMLYTIEDVPPWYMCIILGLQHYMTMFGGTATVSLLMTPALCITDNYLAASEILGTLLFTCGITTLLQTTFGTRLPIMQGGSLAFVLPTFAIMSLDRWKCPDIPVNFTSVNSTMDYYKTDEHKEVWTSRMREIQGGVIGASLVEFLIGFTGFIGVMLRFITPLTVAPLITLLGLSAFESIARYSASHWWISIMTMALITVFSQYLRDVDVPCCSCNAQKGQRVSCSARKPFFKMFPLLLGVGVSWIICAILTVTDVLPSDKNEWGYRARTDVKISVLYESDWFRFPYPGQWGAPTFSVAGVLGMTAGILASIVESIGDYFACASLSEAPPPPIHAVNRGIAMEGLGCLISGLWGAGPGLTSYSTNIGAISITKVASRRIIQFAGVACLLCGVFAKFGAFLVAMPEPIYGGVLMVLLGIVISMGVSNLQYVNMNSSRNLFVFGFSIMFGLSLPVWLGKNPSAISSGSDVADQVLRVLLTTSMLVGGVVGAVLDNTIPGTPEERGLLKWQEMFQKVDSMSGSDKDMKTYEFPFGMERIRRTKFLRYMPVSPTFTGWQFTGFKKVPANDD